MFQMLAQKTLLEIKHERKYILGSDETQHALVFLLA